MGSAIKVLLLHLAIRACANDNIQIAQNLGLSRLGGESGPQTVWPTRWQSLIKREIGRRVWWNLAYLDWSYAQAHQMSYCVSVGKTVFRDQY